jgi:triose/dihydroxyacetone kinase / FAD-AMP lyase (cyclizing)
MDGTSGAIYSIFFAALASSVREAGSGTLDAKAWAEAAEKALTQVQQVTPAKQGDRTLMNALEPFVKSFVKGVDFKVALESAKKGAEATKGMKAAFGRAVYVDESNWEKVGDPGAEGKGCGLFCEDYTR